MKFLFSETIIDSYYNYKNQRMVLGQRTYIRPIDIGAPKQKKLLCQKPGVIHKCIGIYIYIDLATITLRRHTVSKLV